MPGGYNLLRQPEMPAPAVVAGALPSEYHRGHNAHRLRGHHLPHPQKLALHHARHAVGALENVPAHLKHESSRHAHQGQGGHARASAEFDIGKARRFYARGTGLEGDECAKGVDHASAAAGAPLNLSRVPLHLYEKTGQMTRFAKDLGIAYQDSGFAKVNTNLENAQVGDVAVFQPVPGHPAGHTQLLLGHSKNGQQIWASSSIQKYGAHPYGGKEQYAIYRPGKVIGDDAASLAAIGGGDVRVAQAHQHHHGHGGQTLAATMQHRGLRRPKTPLSTYS